MKATPFLCNATWLIIPLVMGAASIEAAQESLFSSSIFPPANAVYTEWAAGPRHYDDVKVRFRYAQFSRWTPQLGQLNTITEPVTNSVTCDVEMEVSTDDGQTYQTCSAQARGIISVKPSGGSTGTPSSVYDTELLQLDISGGTFPLGLRLRESPTLQSTGQTTVRAVVFGGGTTNGASLISSFFDVFTEVSIDDGQTWSLGADGTNAPESSVLEMVGADPEPTVAPVIHPTGLFPSPCDALSCPPGAQVSFSNAATGENTIVSNLTMKLFTSDSYLNLDSVTDATTTVYDCVVQLDLSTDGGNTFESVSGDGHWHLPQLPQGSQSGLRVFQTAMSQLTISNLPGGLQLQADASQVSYSYAKRAAIQDNQRKDVCALDIVSQLSWDGGQTWTTGDQSMQLRLVQQAIDGSVSGDGFPPGGSEFIDIKPPPHAPPVSAGGPYNMVLSGFSSSQSFPSGNGTNTLNFSAHLSGQIYDGTNWNSFSNLSVSVDCGVWRLDSAGVATGDTNRSFYDMEITALDLQGATLPGGVMVRESPSKRSLGRTYFETGDIPSQDRMASFFDIFTELSFDGGQTWSTATSPVTVGLVPSGPSPVPDAPQCPSNITVYATDTNGVAVYYTVPEFFGDCPFGHHLDVSPPSGSTFAVGDTTVNVTAWDDCGLSNTCSFTVTVLDSTIYPMVDWYFPTNRIMPPGSGYMSVNSNHFSTSGAADVIVRDVQLRDFSPPIDPPVLNLNPQSDTFTCDLEYEMSTDGGQTFQSFSNSCVLTLQFKNVDGQGLMHIEFADVAIVGQRHCGFVASESGGQMRVVPQGNGYTISSFFDVFTEVTLDGGQTWIPQADPLPLHLELRKLSSSTTDLLATGTPESTQWFPPPMDFYSSGTNSSSTNKSTGSGAGKVVILDFRMGHFSGGGTIPPGGTNLSMSGEVSALVSLDDGQSWVPIKQLSQMQLQATPVSSNADGTVTFDTEMVSLDLSKDGVPDVVVLRESPTLPSRGQFDFTPSSDGSYRISGFFDIFAEVSTDGGQTWTQMDGPFEVSLAGLAPEHPFASTQLPPLNASYGGGTMSPSFTPATYQYRFSNGTVLSNLVFQSFDQSFAPPQPGDPPQTNVVNCQTVGEISTDNGQSFQPFHAQTRIRFSIHHADQAAGGIAGKAIRSHAVVNEPDFYDTEILELAMSGGNLPGGVMVRESPSKASLGRTCVRSIPTSGGGGVYAISSFFDIFPEISFDSGNTWTAGPDSFTLVLEPGNCPTISFDQATLPPAIAGQAYNQVVTASGGISPYSYTATGNVPPGLSIDSTGVISGTPTVPGAYAFDLTATDQGHCSATQNYTVNVNTNCSDTKPPTVVVTSPKNNAIVTTPTIIATGTATDDIEGSQVLYRLNGRTWIALSITPARWITKCSWTGTIDVDPGTNTLEIIAVDKCGNNSPVITRKIFYASQSTMMLTVHGFGSVTGPAQLAIGANQLNAGQTYKFNAVPLPNNLFSNIVLYQNDVPIIVTNSKNVSFTMGSNTAVTVNFVTNRFIANAGPYTGLYMPASGISYSNSGAIKLNVTRTGAFSGSISSQGKKSPFAGAFGLDGSVIKSAYTGPIDTIPPTLALIFAAPGHGQIIGSMTNPVANWVASITANQAAFSAANPCPLGGSNYTFILPGAIGVPDVPAGDGFATVKISPGGTASFVGKYADGSSLSMSSPLSADLKLPFYQTLYQEPGSKPPVFDGSAIGWVTFDQDPNVVHTSDITWSHGPVSGIPYPNGFTTTCPSSAWLYVRPLTGFPAINVQNMGIVLQDGGLSSAIIVSDATYAGTPAKITIPSSSNPYKISLTIAPTGLMNGSFIPNPALPPVKIYGAVMQSSNTATGFFIGTDSTGAKLSGYTTAQDQLKASPRH